MASMTINVNGVEVTAAGQESSLEECMRAALETLASLDERYGRDDKCVYGGKEFSPGSVIEMPGGPKECKLNGHWSKL